MTSAACDVSEISRGMRTRSLSTGPTRWITARAAHRAMPTLAVALMLATGSAPAFAAESPPPASAQVARSSALSGDDDHDSMPGMDMPARDMPTEAPAQDMPGMDMPAKDMPGQVDEHPESVDRPRGLLIGGFVGINAAILVAASVLRRRTKAERDHSRARRPAAATAR